MRNPHNIDQFFMQSLPSQDLCKCSLTHNSSSCCTFPVLNVTSVAAQTTGSICAAPCHHLDLHTEEETIDQWADSNPDLAVDEERTNARKVRETLTIVVKISSNHSNNSKAHTTRNMPSKPHMQTQKNLLFGNFREIHWRNLLPLRVEDLH